MVLIFVKSTFPVEYFPDVEEPSEEQVLAVFVELLILRVEVMASGMQPRRHRGVNG